MVCPTGAYGDIAFTLVVVICLKVPMLPPLALRFSIQQCFSLYKYFDIVLLDTIVEIVIQGLHEFLT